MANRLQIMRGLKSKISNKILSLAEPYFCTDTRELFIGTGSGNINMGGSHWYNGTAMSGTSTTTGAYSYSTCPQVKVGDYYLNTSNGYIYECTTAGSGTTARWTYRGSLRGATGGTGGTGPQGTRGTRWNVGTACTGTSTSNTQFSTGISDSIIGDMYLNTSTGYVYKCTVAGGSTAARWVYVGSIKERGSKWFTGTAMSDTSTTTGAYIWNDSEQKYVNDMYLNTSNGNIYKCTTAGTGTNARWTYQGCIAGKDAGTYVVTTSDELNAAVTALNSSTNGGKIILREGGFTLSTALITKPIVFEGMGADITTVAHSGVFSSSGVNIAFRNLSITLTTSSSGYDSAILTFDHCNVNDNGTHGDIFIGHGQNIYFNFCNCSFKSTDLLSRHMECSTVMYDVSAYFYGGYIDVYMGKAYRKSIVYVGEIHMQFTKVDFDGATYHTGSFCSEGLLNLDNATIALKGHTCSLSSESGNNTGKVTNCTISFKGDISPIYIAAAVVSGNVFIGNGTRNFYLQHKTNFTNNTFRGTYTVTINGCNKIQRITDNLSDVALSITNCASGSVTTGNTVY